MAGRFADTHHLGDCLHALHWYCAEHQLVLAPLSHCHTNQTNSSACFAQVDLAVAWGLVAVCCTHHLGHFLHELGWHGAAHGPLLAALAQPGVSLALGAAALAGPGRPLVVDGAKSLWRCVPGSRAHVAMSGDQDQATSGCPGAAGRLAGAWRNRVYRDWPSAFWDDDCRSL